MHLDLFKTFLAVAKKGSISRASEELYLTQPAVTKQIQALEQIYERTLFERNHKPFTLTEEGEILIEYANRILSLLDESHASVKDKDKDLTGKLNISSNYTLGIYIIPMIIKFFRDVYPQVQVEVFLANTDTVVKAIKRREAHFGFIGIHMDESLITLHSFYQDKLLVVIGAHHRLKRGVGHWSELLGIPFIGREKGSDIRATYETWLDQKGIRVEASIELNSTEAIKSCVQAGLGFSILPWCTVEQEVRLGLIRTVSVPYFNVVQEFYICHYRDRAFSRVEKVFLEAIFNRLSVGAPRFPESFAGLFSKK